MGFWKFFYFSDASSKRRFHYSIDTRDLDDRATSPLPLSPFAYRLLCVFSSGLSRRSCWPGSLAGMGLRTAQCGKMHLCEVAGCRVCTTWCITSLPSTCSAVVVSTSRTGNSPNPLCLFHSSLLLRSQRDRCSHLFKTKISHLSKTRKSLKDGGVFVKLVILPPPPSPNTEGDALFRGERGTSYETHDKNSLLKVFFILTCNSYWKVCFSMILVQKN